MAKVFHLGNKDTDMKELVSLLHKKAVKNKFLNKEFKVEKEVMSEKILKYMDNKKVDAILFKQNIMSEKRDKVGALQSTVQAQTLKCAKITKNRVIFNPYKVEDSLGKKASKEVILKKYSINNWDGMVALLKKKGIEPKEFIKYVTVEKTVDSDKLNQLESLGKITMDDLEGTYEVEEISSYIQISEVKEGNQ
jgi:hypothetical protein